MDFTIGGSIITDALVVTATSSDTTLVPASAMVITKGAGGARTLTIRGADGRSGVSTITVTVTDPSVGTCTLAGSTSFQFAIGVTAVPTLPEWAMIALMALLAWLPMPPCAGAPSNVHPASNAALKDRAT